MSLADHMGDVYADCEKALKQIGIIVPSILDSPLEDPGGWEHMAHFLVHNYGAETVWGTSLKDDGDE